MKYLLDLTSSKGNSYPGEEINPTDPGEHGHIVVGSEADMLAKTLGGYIQPIDSEFWLLRVDCEGAVGTVLLTAGGDYRTYMFDSTDYPEGAIFPVTTIDKWKKHKLNVALLMSSVEVEWGWAFSIYKSKLPSLAIDQLLEKMFNGQLSPAKPPNAFKYLYAIRDAVDLLRLDDLPLSLLGHCTSTSLVTKYIVLANDYKFKSVILVSPIFMSTFKDPIAPYERFIKRSTIPLLVVNHEADPCHYVSHDYSAKLPGTHVTLNGGVDMGSPNFAVGYHGFRNIEHDLVSSIAGFIT